MELSKSKTADIVSMCLMAVSSLMISTAGIVDYNSLHRSVRVISYLASLAFWISLCAAWIIKLVLYKKIKPANHEKKKHAFITFFSNRYAKIADISTVVLLIALVIAWIAKAPKTGVFITSLFIFAFQMHIALNGRVYKYIYD